MPIYRFGDMAIDPQKYPWGYSLPLAFSPLVLEGLLFWGDVSQMTGSTIVDDKVKTWVDNSGNANNVTAAGTGFLHGNGHSELINGHYALTFPGTADYYLITSPATIFHMAMVLYHPTDTLGSTASFAGTASSYLPLAQNGGTNTEYQRGVGTPTYYKNGVDQQLATRGDAWNYLINAAWNVCVIENIAGSAIDRFFQAANANYPYRGSCAELLIYTDNGVRSDMESYLSDKWII